MIRAVNGGFMYTKLPTAHILLLSLIILKAQYSSVDKQREKLFICMSMLTVVNNFETLPNEYRS